MSELGSIIIIEDDPTVAESLASVLNASGYCAKPARTGSEARALIQQSEPRLIILDLTLPDVDGLVLCASLRSQFDAPIIVCSGSRRHADAVLSMRLGADDFIAKPFDAYELEARVEAVLRRYQRAAPSPSTSERKFTVGPLVLEPRLHRINVAGKVVQLTRAEYRLLSELASHPDEFVTREELANALWGDSERVVGRALDAHMTRIRRKLGDDPLKAPVIVAQRGLGYKLAVPTETSRGAYTDESQTED